MVESFIKDFCIGGIAGCIPKIIFHVPLDSTSLIITLQSTKPGFTYDQSYKGFIDCMIRVSKEEGIFRLWKNSSWFTLSQFSRFGIKFAVYNKFNRNSEKFGKNLIAGGLSGLTLSSIENLYYGISKKDIYNGGGLENGIKNQAFHNFKISFGSVFFYNAFYFGGYDYAKRLILKDTNKNHDQLSLSNFLKKWLIAHCTTVTANILNSPFDIVRRRMQMQFNTNRLNNYKSSFDCFKSIISKEGVHSLFKGGSVKFFRSRGGLSLVIFDEIQKLFLNKNL